MFNNWFLEVRKTLICSVHQFLWYRYSHDDRCQATNITLADWQIPEKFNNQIPWANVNQLQPALRVQCKECGRQVLNKVCGTTEQSWLTKPKIVMQHFNKAMAFELDLETWERSLTVTAHVVYGSSSLHTLYDNFQLQ